MLQIIIALTTIGLLSSIIFENEKMYNSFAVSDIGMSDNTDKNIKALRNTDFDFVYEESGSGIGGPRMLTISYTSQANILEVIDEFAYPYTQKKQLSIAQESYLKNKITQNEFFSTNNSYISHPSLLKCMDCVNYALKITLDKQLHSTKWSSDSPVPEGLWEISNAIKKITRMN